MSLGEIFMQTKYGKNYREYDGPVRNHIKADLERISRDPIVSAKITLKRLGDAKPITLVSL